MVRSIVEGAVGWYKPHNLPNRIFVCTFCNIEVSSIKGYKLGKNNNRAGKQIGGLYVCPNCRGLSFFAPDTHQFPPPVLGGSIQHVPQALGELCEEARRWTSEHCYTAAILLCRKILIKIAVERGASERMKFMECVGYLSDKGYVPQKGKEWVHQSKKKDNQARHDEIALMGKTDAIDLIGFLEMLLQFIYGFPRLVPATM